MKKKKYIKVIDICTDQEKKTLLEEEFEAGSNYDELAKMIGCSANTIKIAVGVLGYESEPWTKPYVDKNLKTIERNKSRRQKRTAVEVD